MRRPRDVARRWGQVEELFRTTGAIRDVEETEYGFVSRVTLDRGHAADRIMRDHKTVAGVFKVVRVEAEPDPLDVSQATLHLIRSDLLVEWAGRPWPGLEAPERLSLWEPIDLAWNQFGGLVRLELTDRPHILLAGQTRSGKSVCMTLFVATGAMSLAQMYLFDRNRFLFPWEPLAEEYVVGDMARANAVLDKLLKETERRYELVTAETAKLHREPKLDAELSARLELPPLLVMIDEGPAYLEVPEFTKKVTQLAARGAASGLRIVFGIQQPTATVIPTSLRANMQRIAFRVQDGPASKVALDTSVVDASEIPTSQQGVCYVDLDGMVPTRSRTFYVTPKQIGMLVDLALEARRCPVPVAA
jgi:FtsK/SpoIIIE family